MDIRTLTTLKSKTSKMPEVSNKIAVSQEEFDSVLMNPELMVVEKHFHSQLETNQVLFVIKNGEIDTVFVKEITSEGTKIFKEI